VDCVDQSFAPGTPFPTLDGLTAHQILKAVSLLGKEPAVKGFDVVDVLPVKDLGTLTSSLAAGTILRFVGGVAQR
jgi:formiminoglutamase